MTKNRSISQAKKPQSAAQNANGKASIEQLRAELENQRLEFEARERENARLDSIQIRWLQNELEKTRDSLRYRLGLTLIMGIKSPRQMIRLPKRLWELYRESKSGQRKRTRIGFQLPSYELRKAFNEGGIEQVVGALKNEFGQDDQNSLSVAIAQAGRTLAHAGHQEAEFGLLKLAAELDGSEEVLRALFWSAQRSGDFAVALMCLKQLECLYGNNPKPAHLEFLRKLNRQPVKQLKVLDLVEEGNSPQFEPVSKRVAYVLHNSLPWSSGGYATRAHGLAIGLQTTGLEVVSITRPGFPLDLKPELKKKHVPASEFVDGIAYRRVLSPKRNEFLLREYLEQSADVLEKEIRQVRPTCIVAASNHVTAVPALIAARRLGIPFIYEVRGFWEITRISREPAFKLSPNFHLQRTFEAEVAKLSDWILTLTGPMKQELISRGVKEEKIALVPNSCDPNHFMPLERNKGLAEELGVPENIPVIGYIGTFVQYEGLEDLASACVLLRDRGYEFRLLLVGNENASGEDKGPITAAIEQIAVDNNLVDSFLLPGRVEHARVSGYYSLIDIAPFPRKPQPVTEMVSPMKPLEALAMEKAVVVSSVTALSEMIEHESTGMVFEKGDVEDLANTLERLIKDPELRRKIGKKGREWVVANRTWEKMGSEVGNIISDVIEKHDLAI